ncbi:phosphatase PAP2 family protein [Xenophilus sp.]|uniref:phosphatase PAP2 family protein n=1 Tax=Xenophilus sp. TaxID=1873499 RepID=UPI0037DCAC9C
MSKRTSAPANPSPKTPAEAARNVREEARFGASFLRRHWVRLLLVFAGVGLPLWAFGELADEVHEGEPFPFDEPLLRFAHRLAGDGLDGVFLLASELGYTGVILADCVLVLALVVRGRRRAGLFATLAFVGSMLLNIGAKHAFGRIRPALWASIAPETTFSFPSGHAMGSMTLACVVVLLWWHLRDPRWRAWRWPVAALAAAFVLAVGLSRIYLGVHYPSDILAGWTAAMAWTVGMYSLVFHTGWILKEPLIRRFAPPSPRQRGEGRR